MSRSVLLLRAVNVSGRNRVPMAELRAALTAAGAVEDVSTYIASGNIICAHPDDPVAACERVRTLIAAEFGVDTPVILRTHDQLVSTLAAHPFVDPVEKMLHAMFLEGPPADGAIDALQDRLVPGEEIALVGDDLWINYGEGGVHSTKLTKAVLDRALGVAGTARNLRTVRTLAELTA
ncbi:DUF1697 domain-containing protein [Microbacterium saperdae]|uniref:Uncharacterized protein (DUF1697 family) n=1 Tax=Microbacterium saperdae TaxID=69368 RepID=A0A543BJS5_9MICO|nr:DUF1697 domain-containing protein [Microbacterium saperdae]TQL85090.1 uncharacterized protein (DUF1697 family) [Microbacterium saperdae]